MSDEEWSDEDIYKLLCNDPQANGIVTEISADERLKEKRETETSESERCVSPIGPKSLRKTRKGKRKIQYASYSDSDSDVPLSKQFPNYKKFQSIETSPESSDYDDDVRDMDFDVQKEIVPSSDSGLSDIPLSRPKRKKKKLTVRKERKPKNCKTLKCLRKKKHPKRPIHSITKRIIAKYAGRGDKKIQQIRRKSRLEYRLHQLILKSHKSRLRNLLHGNNLAIKKTPSNGDCFFNSVAKLLNNLMTGKDLRSKVCHHMRANELHYNGYITFRKDCTDRERHYEYIVKVNEISKTGVWNKEASDIAPLAISNILQIPITIYSSRLNRPMEHITPDMANEGVHITKDRLKLAYLATPGFEHYDAAIEKDADNRSPSKENNCSEPYTTPVKNKSNSKASIATPRKSADYKSPDKKTRTRKRQSNPEKWKKNIRKQSRNMGKEYFSPHTKQMVKAKFLKPHNCFKCKYKCADKVPDNVRTDIFESFYKESMTYERKRDFICRHIIVKPVSDRYGKTYKQNSRTYFLPVNGTLQRTCKQFFLRTLDISDKMVRCTLNRKTHGTFSGQDQRGRHSPKNKTTTETLTHIRQHIESFPVMESHYQRKNTHRKFLPQDLSVMKMYDLYKTKCKEDSRPPASLITYRRTFCNEYNYSFHKPKKDTCQQCNAFKEKGKNNMLTEEDKIKQQEHLMLKERAREAKEADKQKAKTDKSMFVGTFDLEAVLYTPCSNVSQLFYKRKLSCYNLSIYDLATRDGTCYLWDETEAARGSSEIGSCLITHLQGLPRSIKHVVLYSDCCSGQNRNKYIAAGLLYMIKESSHIETISQKFLESGHTQMECDSMHGAIEQAKKKTSIFIPSQWDTVVRLARKTNPYEVVPLRFNQFFDLKILANENFGNFKHTVDGKRVNWIKIKVLHVQKARDNIIQFKYSFDDDDNFMEINVEKKLKRGERRKNNISLEPKYTEKRPISTEKKADLLSLCTSFAIPPAHWPFYKALTTNQKLKDCLAEPDTMEDDEDSS